MFLPLTIMFVKSFLFSFWPRWNFSELLLNVHAQALAQRSVTLSSMVIMTGLSCARMCFHIALLFRMPANPLHKQEPEKAHKSLAHNTLSGHISQRSSQPGARAKGFVCLVFRGWYMNIWPLASWPRRVTGPKDSCLCTFSFLNEAAFAKTCVLLLLSW